MARLRTKHEFLLSKDSTEVSQIYERVQADDELTDAFVVGSSVGPVSIAPLGSFVVNFQGISPVKFLYVECDKEVQLVINGSATPLKVTPRNNTASTPQSLPGRFGPWWTDSVTSLTINNASATDTAKVTVVFAGG